MSQVNNDIFMDIMNNPSMNLADYSALGFKPETTLLKEKDIYKRSEKVRNNDMFKNDNGEFDDSKFDKFYNNVLFTYNAFSTDLYSKNLIDYTFYDKHNTMTTAASNIYKTTPILFKNLNPDKISRGFIGINKLGDRVKTLSEIALNELVLTNPTEATRPDGSVDESKAIWDEAPGQGLFSKLFWSNFATTRVLAQYDTDGFHTDPVTGALMKHVAGELKLNSNGTYYYENLDGRDVYGRLVLNRLNILTPEDSRWNDYDFFDSDDLHQKNTGAVILKDLALVGSMFIPWGVGLGIAALSAGTQITGMLATLGKMTSGSNSPNLSALEGWAQSWNRQYAKTEAASQDTWCMENFIDTFSDLVGLLREQRAIFNLVPGVIKGEFVIEEPGLRNKLGVTALEKRIALKHASLREIPLSLYQQRLYEGMSAVKNDKTMANILAEAITSANLYNAGLANIELEAFLKSYNKIGEALSKTYMAGLISQHMYGEAKSLGLSDIEATAVTAGRFLAEMALLNTPIGEYMFPELRVDGIRYNKLATAYYQLVKDSFEKLGSSATSEAKKNWFQGVIKSAKKFGLDTLAEHLTVGNKTIKTAFVMGAEAGLVNDIEEALNDLAIGTYNTLNWMGTNKTMKHNDLYFDRYAMGFAAGLVGGGITSYAQTYGQIAKILKVTPETASLQLVYMYRNGEIDKFLKYIDKSPLADELLSGVPTDNGYMPADGKNPSLDWTLKHLIHLQVDLIKQLVEEEHANLSDTEFANTALLQKDSRIQFLLTSPIAARYLLEYNSLITEIARLKSEISATDYVAEDGLVKQLQEDQKKNTAQQLADLLIKLKELSDLLAGKKAAQFFAESVAEMSLGIKGLLFPELVSPETYAVAVTGKTLDQLSSEDIKKYTEEFNKVKHSGIVADLQRFVIRNWIELNKKLSTLYSKHDIDYQTMLKNSPYLTVVENINNMMEMARNAQHLLEKVGGDVTLAALDLLTWSDSHLSQSPGLQKSIIALQNSPVYKGFLEMSKTVLETKSKLDSVEQKTIPLITQINNLLTAIDNQLSVLQKSVENTSGEQKDAANKSLNDLALERSDLEKNKLNYSEELRTVKTEYATVSNAFTLYFMNLIAANLINIINPIIDQPFINPVVKTQLLSLIDSVDKLFWTSIGVKNINNKEALYNYKIFLEDVDNTVLDMLDGNGDIVGEAIAKFNAYFTLIGENNPIDSSSIDVMDDINYLYESYQIHKQYENAVHYDNLREEFDMSVNKFKESLAKKTATPVFDFLKSYSLNALGTKHLDNVFDIIDKIWRQNIHNLEELGNEEDFLDLVPEARRIVAMAKASVLAARTDQGGLFDLFNGYNAAVNTLSFKGEGFEPLYEMSPETADAIQADLDLIYNNIRLIDDIINANSGRKLQTLNRVQLNSNFLIYLRARDFLSDQLVNDWHLEDVRAAFNKMKTHSDFVDKDDRLGRNAEERFEMEKEMLEFQDAWTIWAESAQGLLVLNNLDILSKGLQSTLNLYNTEVSVLNLKTKFIDDLAFLNWVTSRMALKATSFNGTLKSFINNDLVPIPTLNEAVYLGLAMHVNKDLFTKMHAALRRAIISDWAGDPKSTPLERVEARKKKLNLGNLSIFYSDAMKSYILGCLPAPQWDNVFLSEGGAGVGKTSGVLYYLARMLKEVDVASMKNAWFVSMASLTSDQKILGSEGAKIMADNAGMLDGTYQTMNHTELLNKLFTNIKGLTDLVTENDWEYNSDGLIISKGHVARQLTDKPTAIFIDEVSHLSYLQTDAIAQVAKDLGIDIYTFGDLTQSGYTNKVSVTKMPNGATIKANNNLALHSHQFITGMKLGVSMRAANELQTYNNSEFIDYFSSKSSNDSKNRKNSITLRYYQDESLFKGVKIYNMAPSGNKYDYEDIDKAILDIRQLIILAQQLERNDFKKVGYIYNDKNSPILARINADSTLKEFILFYEGNSALGREAAYFIVDINPLGNYIDLNGLLVKGEFDKDTYTGITRASEGVILFTTKNRLDLLKNDSKHVTLADLGTLITFILDGPDASTKPDLYSEVSRRMYAEERLKTLLTLIPTFDKIVIKVSGAQLMPNYKSFPGEVIPKEFFNNATAQQTKTGVVYKLTEPILLSTEFIAKYIKEVPSSLVFDTITLNYDSTSKTLSNKLNLIDITNPSVSYTLEGIDSIEMLSSDALSTPKSMDVLFSEKTNPTLLSPELQQLLLDFLEKVNLAENLKPENFEDEAEEVDNLDETAVELKLIASSIASPVELEIDLTSIDGETIDLGSVLYSYNTLVLGAEFDKDTETWSYYTGQEARIDGINGLIKLAKANISQKFKFDTASNKLYYEGRLVDLLLGEWLLAEIWRMSLNSKTKKDLINSLLSLLGLENSSIFATFGLENIPNFSNKNTSDYNLNPINPKSGRVSKFALSTRHRNEHPVHNFSVQVNDVNETHELNVKFPILPFDIIIGTSDTNKGIGKNLLSVELFQYNSPLTVMQTTINSNGTESQPFKPVWDVFTSTPGDIYTKLHKVLSFIEKENKLNGNKKFNKLYKQIYVWLGEGNNGTSYGDFWTVSDDNWVPFGNLTNHGPEFTTHKGSHNVTDNIPMYSASGETYFLPLTALAENLRFLKFNIYAISKPNFFTENLGSAKFKGYDSRLLSGVGHAFILLHHLTENDMVAYGVTPIQGIPLEAAYFNKQLEGQLPKGAPKMKPIWVRTPTETVSNYLQNVENILERNPHLNNLGDSLTPYRLLKDLFDTHWDELTNSIHTDTENLNELKAIVTKISELLTEYRSNIATRKGTVRAWKNVHNYLFPNITGELSNYAKLVGGIYRIMNPLYLNSFTDNAAKVAWKLRVVEMFTDSSKTPIYYKLKRATANSTSALLLLNPNNGNMLESSYEITTLSGNKSILAPGKVDTAVLSGQIIFNDIATNQPTDFIDYVYKQLVNRGNDKKSKSGDNYFNGDSWIRPFKAKNKNWNSNEFINFINEINDTLLPEDVKLQLNSAVEKANSTLEAINAINDLTLPIKATKYTYNNEDQVIIFNTLKLGSNPIMNLQDNVIITDLGTYKLEYCGNGVMSFRLLEDNNFKAIKNVFSKNYKEEASLMEALILNSEFIKVIFSEASEGTLSVLDILNKISKGDYTDATSAHNALATAMILANVDSDTLTDVEGNPLLALIVKDKLKIDQLNGCNTPISIKALR